MKSLRCPHASISQHGDIGFALQLKMGAVATLVTLETDQNLVEYSKGSRGDRRKEWYDDFLKWDPKDFGNLSKIRVPCEKLWLPDIVLYNRNDNKGSSFRSLDAACYCYSRHRHIVAATLLTVDEILKFCRHLTTVKQRRIGRTKFARLSNVMPISCVDDSDDLAGLIRRIVREEIQKVFSAPEVISPLREVNAMEQTVREEDSRALQPTTTKSTWKTEHWRTYDDKPICFHCRRPGHVVRHCRERRQVFAEARTRNGVEGRNVGFSSRPPRYDADDDYPCKVASPKTIPVASPSFQPFSQASECENLSGSASNGGEVAIEENPPGYIAAKLKENFVMVEINGRKIKALVDSGADFSVISDKFRHELKTLLIKEPGPILKAANKNLIETLGKCVLNIEVNGLNISFEFVVMAVIDCGRNEIHLGATSVLESREDKNQRLFASDDFVIPPKSIKKISAINEEICSVRDVLVSTSKDLLLRKEVLIPNSLVTFRHGRGSIWVANGASWPQLIPSGMNMCSMESYENGNICSLIESSDKLQETHLKSREWSQKINLTLDPGLSEIQRLQLVSCLDEFIDIFYFGSTPIKPPSTVKHKINTGDHSPIKQRPYRVAPSERRLIQDEVNKMIENHIVKPSESPWSSTVILKSGLNLNYKKCLFGSRRIKILGHLVDANGIHPDPDKVEAVSKFPRPRNNSELRSFLVLCSYYRRFIENFADKARSLHDLWKPEKQFYWDVAQEKAFEVLKTALISEPSWDTLMNPLIPFYTRMQADMHLRSEVMADLHDAPTAGHLGFARTYNKVKKRFYWPGLYRTVRQYVSHCQKCQRRKKLPRLSKDGNRWIIVCTDYMTRYAITKAIPDGGAIETAKFLVEDVILKHGAPREMITDRGRNFISQVIKEINALCGIAHRFTTAYHPQTNGLTERFNKTLGDMLSMYTGVIQKDWDQVLPYVTFAYNTAKQEATGYTPFFLVHAREAETYIDAILPYLPDEISDDYVGELVTRAEEARQPSRSRHLQSQAKDRRLYDQKHTPVYYQKDNLVYFGPYKVTKKLSEVTYEVEPVDPSSRSRKAKDIVHVIRMKPYLDPEEQHSILLGNTSQNHHSTKTAPSITNPIKSTQPRNSPGFNRIVTERRQDLTQLERIRQRFDRILHSNPTERQHDSHIESTGFKQVVTESRQDYTRIRQRVDRILHSNPTERQHDSHIESTGFDRIVKEVNTNPTESRQDLTQLDRIRQ
ncbi:K02A2.6-like [Cordylochernes scorpioides]|uniref:RNA-directed DNA polymerase n=1 Tax=Cordylochernes scorpioides TaxID=51811 RepID=A0ABY6L8F2_9ARAC|nr:K02A2.6-like [Cordylochernes scorpioides]